MLEIIFKAREEKLASLTYEDKIFLKEHNIDRRIRRDRLNTELEEIQVSELSKEIQQYQGDVEIIKK